MCRLDDAIVNQDCTSLADDLERGSRLMLDSQHSCRQASGRKGSKSQIILRLHRDKGSWGNGE